MERSIVFKSVVPHVDGDQRRMGGRDFLLQRAQQRFAIHGLPSDHRWGTIVREPDGEES